MRDELRQLEIFVERALSERGADWELVAQHTKALEEVLLKIRNLIEQVELRREPSRAART